MAQAKRPVEAGRRAPRIRLRNQDEDSVTSTQLDGTPYVLFFYPKAMTSG